MNLSAYNRPSRHHGCPDRPFVLALIALAVFLMASCSSVPSIPEEAMPCVRAGSADDETVICAVDNEEQGVHLVIYRGGETFIRRAPGLYALHDAAADSSGSYMWLITVGEGHPWLTVVDIGSIARDGIENDPEALVMVDPYPGWIEAQFNGSQLYVRSDINLTHQGEMRDESGNDGIEYIFRIDMESGKLIPAGTDLSK